MTDFVFDQGEAVQTGAAGEHDYEFAGSEHVVDAGKSGVVFVSGTGIGGGTFVVDGILVGAFETNETAEEFYNNINDGSYGVTNSPSERTVWTWVHHSTSTDNWSLNFMSAHDQNDGTYIDWRVDVQNSNTRFNNVLYQDGESPANTGTRADGDYWASFRTASRRDGIAWSFDTGSFTVSPDYRDNPEFDTLLPERIVFIGPEGDPYAEEVYGFPLLIETDITTV